MTPSTSKLVRQREASRRWREKNLDKVRERNREYNKHRRRDYKAEYGVIEWSPQTWLRAALNHARHRAKKRGIAFDIDPADIEIPTRCPVFGQPLEFLRGRGRGPRTNHWSPSLDRTNNSLGYVKGNVRVISQRANALKSDATISELENLLEYLRNST